MQHPNEHPQAVLAPSLFKRLDELMISLTIRCRIAREDGKDLPLAADLARIDFLARRCLDALRRVAEESSEMRIAEETGSRVVTAVRTRRAAPDAIEQAWLLSLLLPEGGAVRWIDGLPVARTDGGLTIVSARPDQARTGEGLVVGLARELSAGIGAVVPDGDRVVAIGILTR